MSYVSSNDSGTLGLASFFLGVSYAGITVWSFGKLKKISEFVTGWTTQRCFYTFIVVHLCVRTLTWATFCWTYFTKLSTWYPYMAILLSFPETLFLATYLLLVMHWVEIYIFTHDQFIFPSRTFFHKRWRMLYVILVVVIFFILAVFYTLLIANLIGNADNDLRIIDTVQAVANFTIPGLFLVTWLYFSWGLSGFGYSSLVEYRRLVKLNRLMALWTFGRVARGVAFVWDDKTADLNSNLVAMVLVTSMVVTELLPCLFTMDWDIVSLLLLADEAPALRITRISTQASEYKLLEDQEQQLDSPSVDSKYHIRMRDLKFISEKEDSAESGRFCVVQKAKYKGRKVFVKTFRFAGLSPEMIDSLSQGLIRSSKISHERLTEFYGVFQVRGSISRLTEYMECGSLRDVLRECSRPLLKESILRLTAGIIEGMKFLHTRSTPIVHGYLKTTNILVGPDMNVKITDIGLRRIKACMELTSLQRSYSAFTAPEAFYGKPPSTASDVYAFGLICWEILSRKPPMEGFTVQQIKAAILQKDERPAIPPHDDLPGEYVNIITTSWDKEAKNRSSIIELQIVMNKLIDIESPNSLSVRNSVEQKEGEASNGGSVVSATVGLVRNMFFRGI